MFLPLPTPQEMNRWDQAAVDEAGMPAEMLMENAAREAFRVLCGCFEKSSATGAHTAEDPAWCLAEKRILCFMGGGNNGGDTAALARLLCGAGATVLVVHTRPLEDFRQEAAWHIERALQAGVLFVQYDASCPAVIPAVLSTKELSNWNDDACPVPVMPDIVVDGLLGTGLRGEVSDSLLALIRHINALARTAFVFSLDIPSGMDGLTGLPSPECVCARCTVTFQAPKTGLLHPEAKEYTGRLHIRDIGIPPAIQHRYPTRLRRATCAVAALPPPPSAAMHKGTAGRVLVIGGSAGLCGAPLLAAAGALRAGAGLVTVAVPARLEACVRHGNPDIMTLPLACGDDWAAFDARMLEGLDERYDAVIVGNGMGRSAHAGEALAEILKTPRPASVIDADALFHLRHPTQMLALMRETDILTPHPGEMAFLTGLTIEQVQADRLAALEMLTRRTAATCILKGAGTLVGSTQSFTAFIDAGGPSLAVGGSGDVLAGICAAFAAQGLGAFNAAAAAAFIHGKAGELLLQEFPLRGTTASEIADTIPRTRKELYHA